MLAPCRGHLSKVCVSHETSLIFSLPGVTRSDSGPTSSGPGRPRSSSGILSRDLRTPRSDSGIPRSDSGPSMSDSRTLKSDSGSPLGRFWDPQQRFWNQMSDSRILRCDSGSLSSDPLTSTSDFGSHVVIPLSSRSAPAVQGTPFKSMRFASDILQF